MSADPKKGNKMIKSLCATMIDTRTLLFQALVLFMSLPANFSKMFKRKEVFVKRFSLYYSPL